MGQGSHVARSGGGGSRAGQYSGSGWDEWWNPSPPADFYARYSRLSGNTGWRMYFNVPFAKVTPPGSFDDIDSGWAESNSKNSGRAGPALLFAFTLLPAGGASTHGTKVGFTDMSSRPAWLTPSGQGSRVRSLSSCCHRRQPSAPRS